MQIWNKYKNLVMSSFPELGSPEDGIAYWRDYLFIITLLYIVPLSLLALIPGVIVSITGKLYSIAIFDVFAAVFLAVISFTSWFSIFTRKILFTIMVYLLAIVMLTALGSYGPGLIYLLAVSVFMVIIFPYRYAFLPVFINILFCIAYGLLIYLEIFEIHQSDSQQIIEWAAISTNLIFLNAVFSVLIPKMFGGMQKSLEEQRILKEALSVNQKNLETSLKTLKIKNRELEQFAYVTSHDLQEPLRMISSFLTQLKKKYGNQLDEKALKYIDFAVGGSKKMRSVILSLLDFALVDKYEYELEQFDLKELINELKNYNKIEAHLSINYSGVPVINSYKKPLTVVLQNLLNNAIKFKREGIDPEINIEAKESESEWQFTFRDNGIGIESEYHDKIFIIFQRLHNEDKYKGAGMGLSIVKKLIEHMNGRIWVESNPENGSTFYFTISKNIEL